MRFTFDPRSAARAWSIAAPVSDEPSGGERIAASAFGRVNARRSAGARARPRHWLFVALAVAGLMALGLPAPAAAAVGVGPDAGLGGGLSPWPVASAGSSAGEGPDHAAVDRALRATLGGAYGGFWLEGDVLVAGITDAGRADAVRALGARPRLVEHAAGRLDAIKADLDRRWTRVPDKLASWGVDLPTNSVVVYVVGADPAALAFAEAARARSAAIRIEHVAHSPRPTWNIVGGQEIRIGFFFLCSLGFSAFDRRGSRYVLTAGHCTDADDGVSGVGGPIGTTADSSYPGDDYARIRVTSSAASSTALVDGYSARSDVTVTGMTTTPIGGRVCKSGRTTQWTCGTVQAFNQTVNYGDGNIVGGLTKASVCNDSGDSGGSFVSDPGDGSEVHAQGMTSGRLGEDCEGVEDFGFSWFQPIGEALTAYDLILYVAGSPIAPDDDYAMTADSSLSVPAPGVLANDHDPESDPLAAALATAPAHGTLTLAENGSFTYTPDAGFAGTDTFTYTAGDGTNTSNTATVTITVTHRPTANDDAYTTAEDTALTIAAPGVLGNDSDADGDTLSAALASAPAHGSLNLSANGSFAYTPDADFNGSDTFTYRANDGGADSDLATVTIVVTAVADAPVAAGDAYNTAEDAALTVAAAGVLANDSDADGDPLTAALVSGPGHGALTLNGNGSFDYVPAADFNGTDSFTYTATDGALDSNTATVTITVIAVNDAPVAANDAYHTRQDTPLTVATPGVLGNDSDVDRDPLTAVPVSAPAHGTLTLNADGSFTYNPNANYYGPDTFTYRASDGALASSAATVELTVRPVYVFTGFAAPINNGFANGAKAGQTIPVRYRLTLTDGTPVSDPASFVSVSSQSGGGLCAGLPLDAIETYAGGSGLNYLGDGNWQFNWKTPKEYAGQCRTMILTLEDASTHTATFQFM